MEYFYSCDLLLNVIFKYLLNYEIYLKTTNIMFTLHM